MDPGEFVFIQEMGTGSHKPKTKSLIKMHVMDRVVMKRRGRKEEPSRGRDLTAESSRGDQSSSINQYVEHDDLRPTVGVDDMLRLSGFSLQFLCGDVEEAKVHFQGLRGMIRSRKGVLNLGFQGLAARIDGLLPRTAIKYDAII
ncbi:hypothetical protein TRIATDRAFT_308158 [Trichoderma atroviride IMI 206040]|uniref:Uncharacterized protein n=1 Tax=Hypocrea atroviridis (strain ATCC 20476 / IMI 206040) TaxID=452589 RepID=G9NTW1_HYPAI|nr:uncharacterized protein TRIATDRAFT_308158 [Trichoderma atroviride IMI 206040]EHK46148.1 hypothetical protein TRIATDRAFT_308158 [Trichoderma atroviride IMI 206040]